MFSVPSGTKDPKIKTREFTNKLTEVGYIPEDKNALILPLATDNSQSYISL
jgi:hypothetical protein